MRAIVGILIAATLVVGSGCAKTDWIDRTLVTVDVTGNWHGAVGGVSVSGSAGRELLFELEQQGSTVKGFVRLGAGGQQPIGSGLAPVAGTVAGDVFRFKEARGSVEGELTVSGDQMDGRVSLFGGNFPLSLRRIDPPARPNSPPR